MTSVCSALNREDQSLDKDWRFALGDKTGASAVVFDDSSWRAVNVPHDWSIEGPFSADAATTGAGGFLPSGVAWYRRSLEVPAHWKGRRIFVEFDGVMANSEVWVNGVSLGRRPNGYVSFRYEITEQLKYGTSQTNVLAVRCDTSAQPASRWYTGAGIYRNVRLLVIDDVHFDYSGQFVTTTLTTGDKGPVATVHVRSTVVNQCSIPRRLSLRIQSPDTKSVVLSPACEVPAGATADLEAEFILTSPVLWDIEAPYLYALDVGLSVDDLTVDSERVSFGVRDAHFEPATGFWLNGRNLKLKGVCLHQDGGAFGVAVPYSVWEQRLKELRELGVNAVRTSHNPVDPGFLDLCDRLGFLVLSEQFDVWQLPKLPADYAQFFDAWAARDLRDTLRRDRNHPCIIAYSAGNEIHDTTVPDTAKRVLATLLDIYHREDSTRPVTQALFRPNRSGDYANGLADMLDVVGQNYRERELTAAWNQRPTRKVLGTENGHDRQQWLAMRDNAFFGGQFLWTGIDYLGEARQWPQIASDFGLLDRTGRRKPRAYERASWWSDKPVLGVFRRVAERHERPIDPGYETAQTARQQFAAQQRGPDLLEDWTPSDLSAHEELVEVYSNCESVELFLNGRSFGSQRLPSDASARRWKLPFAAGVLRAEGRNGKDLVVEKHLQTAGPAAGLRLSCPARTPRYGLGEQLRVEVQVVDSAGLPVPQADALLHFSVEGPMNIVAVDNGDNSSHESFRGPERSAYQGGCVVFVEVTQARAKCQLKVAAPGLAPATFDFESVP